MRRRGTHCLSGGPAVLWQQHGHPLGGAQWVHLTCKCWEWSLPSWEARGVGRSQGWTGGGGWGMGVKGVQCCVTTVNRKTLCTSPHLLLKNLPSVLCLRISRLLTVKSIYVPSAPSGGKDWIPFLGHLPTWEYQELVLAPKAEPQGLYYLIVHRRRTLFFFFFLCGCSQVHGLVKSHALLRA